MRDDQKSFKSLALSVMVKCLRQQTFIFFILQKTHCLDRETGALETSFDQSTIPLCLAMKDTTVNFFLTPGTSQWPRIWTLEWGVLPLNYQGRTMISVQNDYVENIFWKIVFIKRILATKNSTLWQVIVTVIGVQVHNWVSFWPFE